MSDRADWVREYPGATTAIVFGVPDWEAAAAWGGLRAILWCDPTGAVEQWERLPNQAWRRMRIDDPWPKVLEQFLRKDARRLPSLGVSGGEGRAEQFAATVAELERQHRARVTREQDGFRWQKQVLANLPRYVRRPLPESWRGALAGVPAVVCGAGPSLDVSAPVLASRGAGCAVFAADSALRTLARHGVEVDFTVSIDVAKVPERCLVPGRDPGRVVLSAVSPPEWRAAVPEARMVFAANRQITTDWVTALGGVKPALSVAESCGVTALELARWMGCAPISLFGLDLALSGETRHTAGADAAIYTHSGFTSAQSHPEVEGNWQPVVATHVIGDVRALNERLRGWPVDLLHNVNDRGARLANTMVVRPEDWAGNSDPAPKRAALAALPDATVIDEESADAVLRMIARTGHQLSEQVPALRRAFAERGPSGLVQALRPLLADREQGRALGALALKLMPHLMPPTEGDAAVWQARLTEFEAIVEALASMRA